MAVAVRWPIIIFRILVVAAPLVGCASRPETGFLSPVAETAAGGGDHTLLVATTRERDARPGTFFNGERASSSDYATITVSIPQKHVPGQIEWAATAPGDPNSNFVVREAAYLDGDKEFVRALNAQLAMRPRGGKKVFVFIHGYNTLFAEGLYRFAQVVHDSKAPGVPVLFTWASRGKLADYVYDTNSATAARDNLEHTLRLILASDAEQVNILAHSMGNWVTVEALRQIKISGQLEHVSKFGYVFLAAPDIDLDVFKSGRRSQKCGRAGSTWRHRDRPDGRPGYRFIQPRQICSTGSGRAGASGCPWAGDRREPWFRPAGLGGGREHVRSGCRVARHNSWRARQDHCRPMNSNTIWGARSERPGGRRWRYAMFRLAQSQIANLVSTLR